jgi:hypothetical protein
MRQGREAAMNVTVRAVTNLASADPGSAISAAGMAAPDQTAEDKHSDADSGQAARHQRAAA